MIKRLITVSFCTLFFVVSGCSDDKSSRYLGKWKSISGAPAILEIVKNGDNFIVIQNRVTSNCMIFGKPTPESCYKLETKQQAASFQPDGTLKIEGFVPAVLVYVEKDNTLLANKGDYLMGGTYAKADDLKKDDFLRTLRQMK